MGHGVGPALCAHGRRVPQPQGTHPLVTQCPEAPGPSAWDTCNVFSLAVHRGRTRCMRASPLKTSLRLVASPLVSPEEGAGWWQGPGRLAPGPAHPPSPCRCGRGLTSRPRCTSASSTWRPSRTATDLQEEEEEEEDKDSAAAPSSWHQALCTRPRACPVVGLPSAL